MLQVGNPPLGSVEQYAGEVFSKNEDPAAAVSSVSLLENRDVLSIFPVNTDFQVFSSFSFDGAEYFDKIPTSSLNDFKMHLSVCTRRLSIAEYRNNVIHFIQV